MMRTSRNRRNPKGYAIAESAGALVLMSLVFVLVAAFAVNAYSYMVYGAKIQIIANAVAKQVSNRTYWLGAKRPMFQRQGAGLQATRDKANAYAAKLGQLYGLPITPIVTIPDNPDESVDGVAFTPITVSMSQVPLPFQITSVFPQFLAVSAVGISSEQKEAPPGFIRLGFRLIDPSVSNPSVTNATQVVILPAYGFQTDAVVPGGAGNLGGTANNNDVVGNQPDATKCLWAGINGSPDPLRSNAPYITTPDGRYINTFN